MRRSYGGVRLQEASTLSSPGPQLGEAETLPASPADKQQLPGLLIGGDFPGVRSIGVSHGIVSVLTGRPSWQDFQALSVPITAALSG